MQSFFLEDVVALSSTEAGYMAISHAMQEGLCMRMLQKEVRVNREEGGTLRPVHNQSSIKLAKNPGASTLQFDFISFGRNLKRGRWV